MTVVLKTKTKKYSGTFFQWLGKTDAALDVLSKCPPLPLKTLISRKGK